VRDIEHTTQQHIVETAPYQHAVTTALELDGVVGFRNEATGSSRSSFSGAQSFGSGRSAV
jgi:hypothetical protein